MKMTGSREGFGNDKPLWKQKKGASSLVSRPHSHGKRKLKQNPQKIKRKRKGQKSGCDIHPRCPHRQIGPIQIVKQIWHQINVYMS